MSANVNVPVDEVGLREELSKLTLDKLRDKFVELGIESVYKNGANKASLIEKGIAAYVELKNSTEEVDATNIEVVDPETVEDELDTIPEGEYDIDEETLADYPKLEELGYKVGDTLVVDSEGKWTKINNGEEGEIDYTKIPKEDPGFGTHGITTRKSPEEVDAEIKEANKHLNLDGNIVSPKEEDSAPIEEKFTTSEGYTPEVIDETRFTEEELEENIEICTANCNQALPQTKIFLLRKIDSLRAALDRKRQK